MTQEKHNGWTNYATWRVALENIDATQWTREDFTTSDNKDTLDANDFAEFFKQMVEDAIDESAPEGLANDYAHAFIAQVNWYEIGANFAKGNPDIANYQE